MTKEYCDGCGKNISRNYVSERIRKTRQFKKNKVEIEIMIAINNTWNDGELCLECLRKILQIV